MRLEIVTTSPLVLFWMDNAYTKVLTQINAITLLDEKQEKITQDNHTRKSYHQCEYHIRVHRSQPVTRPLSERGT